MSRRPIGGALDPRMLHFRALDWQQQMEAIRRLAATGMAETTIAAASGLSVEMVRRVLAKTAEATQ